MHCQGTLYAVGNHHPTKYDEGSHIMTIPAARPQGPITPPAAPSLADLDTAEAASATVASHEPSNADSSTVYSAETSLGSPISDLPADSILSLEAAASAGLAKAAPAAVKDVARQFARKLEIDSHPAYPAGAEVHSDGIWHQVQKGDGWIAIAREYSQAFHMDISQKQLQAANPSVSILHPGQLLEIPGLEARTDGMFDGGHPNLKLVGNELRHIVSSGNTLSNIAKDYSEANGLNLTWKDIFNVNKDVVGSDPNKIKPGQALRIPGITMADPKVTNRSISDMDGDQLLTRTSRVRHENGQVETLDIVAFHANGSHAERIGNNANDAVLAAKKALGSDAPRSWQYAVTQANDGAYWIVPLNGREISDNLDDSDKTLSLAYRADDREVSAIVTKDYQGSIGVRRYDI